MIRAPAVSKRTRARYLRVSVPINSEKMPEAYALLSQVPSAMRKSEVLRLIVLGLRHEQWLMSAHAAPAQTALPPAGTMGGGHSTNWDSLVDEFDGAAS